MAEESVTFEGTARDAKAGAVCVGADGNVRYVIGLDEWPDLLSGHRVVVIGRRSRQQQHVPVASQDAHGAWTAGKSESGPDGTIEGARWMPAAPWSLRFADGCGNCSHIATGPSAASVEWSYDPVTPRESSSGEYSGGEPRRGAASRAAAAELWASLFALLDAHDAEGPTARMMQTGMVTVSTASGKRSLVVKKGAALAAFEAALATFCAGAA